jgi:hypothetical protein
MYKQSADSRKGRPAKITAGRPKGIIKYLKLTLLIALALIFSGTFAAAEDVEGYDENTELRLTGNVLAISRDMRGPVIVRLKTGTRVYDIYTGPPWFWDSAKTGIRENMRIQVIGSKMIGRDGSLRIICRQMKNLETGRVITFRDESLTPLWPGTGRRGGPHR